MVANRRTQLWLFIVLILLAVPASAEAGVVSGLMKVVGGVFQIPRGILAGTFGGPPILGTAVGALTGTLQGVAMVAGGALETVFSLVPLALKVAPLIPIFT